VRLDHLLSKESHRVGEAYRDSTMVAVVLISDSVSWGSRAASVGARMGRGWVEHDHHQRSVERSSAHCWVLRRHLVGVVLWQGYSWFGVPNAFGVGVVVPGSDRGVVVC
jgi:hypothetical protein